MKAYAVALRCSQCLNTLYVNRGMSDRTVECTNPACTQRGVKYDIPQFELKLHQPKAPQENETSLNPYIATGLELPS